MVANKAALTTSVRRSPRQVDDAAGDTEMRVDGEKVTEYSRSVVTVVIWA